MARGSAEMVARGTTLMAGSAYAMAVTTGRLRENDLTLAARCSHGAHMRDLRLRISQEAWPRQMEKSMRRMPLDANQQQGEQSQEKCVVLLASSPVY